MVWMRMWHRVETSAAVMSTPPRCKTSTVVAVTLLRMTERKPMLLASAIRTMLAMASWKGPCAPPPPQVQESEYSSDVGAQAVLVHVDVEPPVFVD